MAPSLFQCVIHGSFRHHFDQIQHTRDIFSQADISVLAPQSLPVSKEKDGFIFFSGEENQDRRLIELNYLSHLRQLGENGFSYFVNPDGYIGRSAAYELGIAQATGTQCYFSHQPKDLPVYIGSNTIWPPEALADYIVSNNHLPPLKIKQQEKKISALWNQNILPSATLAAGAIIEFRPKRYNREPSEVLFVQTHKWGGRWSVIGERVRKHETIHYALKRGIYEETGLEATIGQHICTFDQLPKSGYYLDRHQIFTDRVVQVSSRQVKLDKREAQNYIWIPPQEALRHLSLEPNAFHTLNLYLAAQIA